MTASSTAQRQHMILGQIFTNEVTDKRILSALMDIPREAFMPDHLRGAAYVDEDLQIAPGRYELAPLTAARLLALAEIGPSERVLVVGCLNGYVAALAARLGGHVVAVDTESRFIESTVEHLKRLRIGNVNAQLVKALPDGYAMSAPYNAVIVCGAVRHIPDILGSQLAVGGRLAAVRSISVRPGSHEGLGKGMLVRRLDHKLQTRDYFDTGAALLPGFEQESGFTF